VRVLRCAGDVSERFLGCLMSLGSCDFFPTHSPNPSPAPPGGRGELHVAASLKVGTLRLTTRWPQGGANPATSRCSQMRLRISSPILTFQVCSLKTAHSGQALPQRQLASNCLQRIENPRTSFYGNAPKRTFFPPSKTRPHVAVSSLSAPAGVERVGVRGGIQRIKIKNAADNRVNGPGHAERIASESCKRDPKNA